MAIPPRVSAIIDDVAAEHGVTRDLLLGDRQRRKESLARFDLYWRLRHMPYGVGYPSLSQIGRWLNRDHSSILLGLQKYETARALKAVA